MNTLLATLEEEFHAALEASKNSTIRPYSFPVADSLIKVAIGMRRSGKTYFLFQTIRKLVSEGVNLNTILYLNFEDDRLLPLTHKEMGKMIDDWYTLYPANHKKRCYLFVDEVQNVEQWFLVLRRLLDTKNIQIYATGSSAKLLSKEIATSLRGRSLSIEVFPYGYQEYLNAQQLTLPKSVMGKQALDEQHSYLLDYFSKGGFPAVQQMSAKEHLETLQNYVETVIFRDVVERHQVTNIALLKYLISFLLKNIAAPFSINKFYNAIKSQGYKAAKDTLYAYLGYLEDAFLVFAVPIFTESLRHLQTTPKKIYAIDNGLISANTLNISSNIGKLFENQVYLDLRRQEKKIFYYHTKEGYEIDFVTQDSEGRYELLQVAWDINDPVTFEREKRALKQAEEELGIPGRIIDWQSYVAHANSG